MLLPPIPQPGQPLAASWGRYVVEYLRSLTPTAGPGVEVSHMPGGTTIRAKRSKRSAASAEPEHPFQVITRIKPGNEENEPVHQAAVLVGTLLKSPKWDDRVIITGLAVPDATTGEIPDSSWFDLIANDAIWLEITFPALTAEINSWGAGDEWADFTSMVEFSEGANPVQTKAFFPIAYTHADADGKPKLFQSLSSNLLLVPACHNSRACRYPTPYPLGAYLPT